MYVLLRNYHSDMTMRTFGDRSPGTSICEIFPDDYIVQPRHRKPLTQHLGGSGVQGHLRLHSKFETSLRFERPCQKKT